MHRRGRRCVNDCDARYPSANAASPGPEPVVSRSGFEGLSGGAAHARFRSLAVGPAAPQSISVQGSARYGQSNTSRHRPHLGDSPVGIQRKAPFRRRDEAVGPLTRRARCSQGCRRTARSPARRRTEPSCTVRGVTHRAARRSARPRHRTGHEAQTCSLSAPLSSGHEGAGHDSATRS